MGVGNLCHVLAAVPATVAGGWVGTRAGLDRFCQSEYPLPPTGDRITDRPTHSKSLYGLCSPGPENSVLRGMFGCESEELTRCCRKLHS